MLTASASERSGENVWSEEEEWETRARGNEKGDFLIALWKSSAGSAHTEYVCVRVSGYQGRKRAFAICVSPSNCSANVMCSRSSWGMWIRISLSIFSCAFRRAEEGE